MKKQQENKPTENRAPDLKKLSKKIEGLQDDFQKYQDKVTSEQIEHWKKQLSDLKNRADDFEKELKEIPESLISSLSSAAAVLAGFGMIFFSKWGFMDNEPWRVTNVAQAKVIFPLGIGFLFLVGAISYINLPRAKSQLEQTLKWGHRLVVFGFICQMIGFILSFTPWGDK